MNRSVHAFKKQLSDAHWRICETPAYIVLHQVYVTTFVSIENETKNKIKQENLNCKKMCLYSIWGKSTN